MRTCNAESQKRSAKGFNFKEDDRALPLLVLLLYLLLEPCLTLNDRSFSRRAA